MCSGRGTSSNLDGYSIKQRRRKWLGSNWEDKMEEKRRLEEGKDSTIYIYPRLFKNTCLRGHFKYLKIENHRAYGPLLFLPQPPETVSQTAMVIGSESFCTSTFKWILNLWGKHLWLPPEESESLCGSSPALTSGSAGFSCLQLPPTASLSSKVKCRYTSRSARSTDRQTEGERFLFGGMLCRVFRGSWYTTLGTQTFDTFPELLWFLGLG